MFLGSAVVASAVVVAAAAAGAGAGSGAGFDAGEADALRKLREQQAMVIPRGGEDIYVTDGVKKYSLFVRDELPVDTTTTLTAFETKSWKVIEDAANRQAEKELAARDAGSP